MLQQVVTKREYVTSSLPALSDYTNYSNLSKNDLRRYSTSRPVLTRAPPSSTPEKLSAKETDRKMLQSIYDNKIGEKGQTFVTKKEFKAMVKLHEKKYQVHKYTDYVL